MPVKQMKFMQPRHNSYKAGKSRKNKNAPLCSVHERGIYLNFITIKTCNK